MLQPQHLLGGPMEERQSQDMREMTTVCMRGSTEWPCLPSLTTTHLSDKAINHSQPPSAVQCVVNPLNSAGAIGYVSENFNPSSVLSACQKNDIPILAIRVVQAGALTDLMDRLPHSSGFDKSDFEDFKKAKPFRDLANTWNESPASLAHRYALSIPGVSSVILGVKNREELLECIQAETKGLLSQSEIKTIEGCIEE